MFSEICIGIQYGFIIILIKLMLSTINYISDTHINILIYLISYIRGCYIDTIFIYDAIGILIGIFVCGKTMINTFYNVENMP